MDILSNTRTLTAIASVTFGVVGSFVVARRIGYLAGAIAHSAFGGVGFGLWFKQELSRGALGALALAAALTSGEESGRELCGSIAERIQPIPVAIVFSILAAALVDWIRRRAKEREETLIGAVWAIGAALGLLFLEKVDGYASATTYLFGDVLLVSKSEILFAGILSGVILIALFFNFKKLEAVCFDEEFAELRGINVQRQNRLLLMLTAITVVLFMRVVGMALVVTLLTLPAATASRFTKRLSSTIFASICVCLLGSLLGVDISYRLNLATGPTITLVVAAFYVVALAVSAFITRFSGALATAKKNA